MGVRWAKASDRALRFGGPLTPAVPHSDDKWFDVVKLTSWVLVNAEELGVSSQNVDEMRASESIEIRRLLGVEGTLIVVTHEMGFAREVCDRIVFFDEGLIVEDAPPAEFFANPKSERTRLFLS